MNAYILNRDFQHPADGWYQIEPMGEHPNTASGVVQVIDPPAAQSIVNRFNADAAAGKLSHGSEMLIDHEHFKHDHEKETRAYGWLYQLQNRADGIYGRIRWTTTGEEAVNGGDYRFFSTEYDPADLKVLNDGKPRRVRPLRLDGLTLTNQPNNHGGKPITNRSSLDDAVGFQDAEFSLPDLEKWFRAVKHIQDVAAEHGGVAIGFNHAWDLAREQHPDLYSAAFAKLEQADDAQTDDNGSAAAQVKDIANRVRNATSKDFDFGWNFVRRNLPAIYNRMLPRAERILNREQQKTEPAIRQKAAQLFERLTRVEAFKSGVPFEHAWGRVMNREKVLSGLAAGKFTPEEAFARQPDLRGRL